LPTGVILKGIGGFYYVLHNDTVVECKARGIFRKKELTPLPGDNVDFSINQEDGSGNIDKILPRTVELIRPAVANVNQLIATIAVSSPRADLMLLDKLLIMAEKEGIQAIICVNKIDLDDGNSLDEIVSEYKLTGYPIILSSSKTKEGLNELREMLKGKITVLAGQSGVGKSTLINTLMQSYVMETGDVSGKIGRGKHTTRHAELIPLAEGGFLVDTPGFSSFEITGWEPSELQAYYPEFVHQIGACRFNKCSHVHEPDCAVKLAIQEGEISRGRYDRYSELYKIIKENYDSRYR
jgi:ribosome biogenesis GTPase